MIGIVTLAEDLFLLAHHETTGRLRIPTEFLDLGLGGALLLDLKLHERVALDDDDHVAVVDKTPLSESELLAVPGVGPAKLERYGKAFLDLLAAA